MRIRLVHTLSLMLLAAVLLAVLGMGAVFAWQLRSGFADYLLQRDVQQLEHFAEFLGEEAQGAGGISALASSVDDPRANDPNSLRAVMDAFAQRQGHPPRPMPQDAPQDRPPPPRDGLGAPPRPRPEMNGIDAFEERVSVYTPEGNLLLGKEIGFPTAASATRTADDAPSIVGTVVRPVLANGALLAYAYLRVGNPPPNPLNAHFVRSQYLGISLAGVTLVLLALGLAWWAANYWVRPLLAIQATTARIAQGQLDARLSTTRSDEIGDVMRNINSMAQGLQQLEGARRRWVAELSHELRTPLAVLRGEMDALTDGVRPLNVQAVQSLREEVMRLVRLVDDLHLLAMSDLNALPCYFEQTDVVELVHSVLARFALRAEHLRIDFELVFDGVPQSLANHTESTPSLWVQWDGRRIEQLLSNLLDNSLRYTDSPGRVRVTLGQVQVQAQVQNPSQAASVHLSVEDSAPAVAEQHLAHLFEPLFRADAARSQLHGGSGLGLAICKAIVQAHSGRMSARRSALGGLCIDIELPIDKDQAQAAL